MNVVTRKLSEIIPYKNNPREKNDSTVNLIVESIEEFGFKNPIIVDERGVIICGHARFKAAQMLGMDEVPTITASGLSKAQIKAFRLADNKTAELAAWDYNALEKEFAELKEEGFDIRLTGFDEEVYNPPHKNSKKEKFIKEASSGAAENENTITSLVMTIICNNEDEKQRLADLLCQQGELKHFYEASEIICNTEQR